MQCHDALQRFNTSHGYQRQPIPRTEIEDAMQPTGTVVHPTYVMLTTGRDHELIGYVKCQSVGISPSVSLC